MSTKQTRRELILPIDWEIIDAMNGFTFDMGGSVMKCAFIDKDDYAPPSKRKPKSKGNLHLVNFSRNELDEAYQFIKDRAMIPQPKADGTLPQIYSSGFGGTQFQKKVAEVIKVRNNQLLEMECFNESLMYLIKNLPIKDIVHPICKDVYDAAKKKCDKVEEAYRGVGDTSALMNDMLKRLDLKGPHPQLKPADVEKPFSAEELFPCGLMMCGTGFAFSVVTADGKSKMTSMSMKGGKTLLCMASLMVHTKSFEELMELAAKGDARPLSDTNLSFIADTDADPSEDDVYGKMMETYMQQEHEEETAILFGRCEGKTLADFKREDIARCLLETYLVDVAHMAVDHAVGNNLTHVFFSGGLTNHPLMREILTFHFLEYNDFCGNSNPNWTHHIQLHFLIHGQSLGAIGAALNHKFNWSEKNKLPAPKA